MESFEAGMVLQGSEVKSLRRHHASIQESYAKLAQGEIFIYNMNIMHYAEGGIWNHDPMRPRKLLLNRAEIDRIVGKWSMKNTTLIPLKVYLKNHRVKVEIAVVRRKEDRDRRDDIKKQDLLREMRKEGRRLG